MITKKQIETQISPSSLYLVGFADLGGILEAQYAQFSYGIVLARRLDDAIIDDIENGPTRPYLDLYRSVNQELAENVNRIAFWLNARGVESQAMPPTFEDQGNDAEYNKTLRKSFSHKMAATRAGIGWIGKTDLLVTKEFGPRVRLASVLTLGEINALGTPITESQCGECSACVDACPAHAASGKPWNTTIDRNEFYDPFKCQENCRKLTKEKLGENLSLCGICVSVCPQGRNPAS